MAETTVVRFVSWGATRTGARGCFGVFHGGLVEEVTRNQKR